MIFKNPFRIKFTIISLTSMVMGIGTVTGCAVGTHPTPVPGLAAYELNSLDAYDKISMDQARTAALQALDRLGFIVIKRNLGPENSEFVARTQGNRKIEIRMSAATPPLLHTRIKVGTVGDESLSRLVMDHIRQRFDSRDIASGQ